MNVTDLAELVLEMIQAHKDYAKQMAGFGDAMGLYVMFMEKRDRLYKTCHAILNPPPTPDLFSEEK